MAKSTKPKSSDIPPSKEKTIRKASKVSRKAGDAIAAAPAAILETTKTVNAAKPPRARRIATVSRLVAAPPMSPEERRHLIEVAAYCIAERRGFSGGSADADWHQAEREVDALIAAGHFAG
jgi:hypothetical protein